MADAGRNAGETFVYRVDAQNEISEVSDLWLQFAANNGAPDLTRDKVLGRSLLDFIADMETAHLYELLLDRVRLARTSLSIRFRCDSPDCRRYMELELVPLPDNGIELRSHLRRLEPRAEVQLLKASARQSGQVLSLCGWCKRVRVREDWLEVEDAIERLNLFGEVELPPISHVTCDDCYDHAMKVLRLEAGAGAG